MKVLVLDAEARSALAATRALGQRGHTVFTAGRQPRSLASSSRHSRGFHVYPDPYTDGEGFIRSLAHLAGELGVDVVLPMTEISTLLVTAHRGAFPPHVAIPFGSHDVVSAAADKSVVLAKAATLGIPVPRMIVLNSPGDPLDPAALGFPCVMKPARSRVQTAGGWVSSSVTYLHDEDDIRSGLAATDPAMFPVLLQERIVGPGVGVFAFCDHGRTLARFSHRRIREKPPSGGVSVVSESAPLDPVAADHAAKLLEAMRWHGVAMVEFKKDERDGSLRLMEINGRFWGSLQLAIDAGVNFPAMLVEQACGRPVEPVDHYELGVRCRWFWGDVDHLLAIISRRRGALDLPPGYPGRLRALSEFLGAMGPGTRNEVWRRTDPAPGLLETREWFRSLFAR